MIAAGESTVQTIPPDLLLPPPVEEKRDYMSGSLFLGLGLGTIALSTYELASPKAGEKLFSCPACPVAEGVGLGGGLGLSLIGLSALKGYKKDKNFLNSTLGNVGMTLLSASLAGGIVGSAWADETIPQSGKVALTGGILVMTGIALWSYFQ